MNKSALIFGAGKTGRGFAAHLAFLGGYRIVLIDKKKQLVDDLKNAGQYDIQVFNNAARSGTIPVSAVYQVDDVSWHDEFIKTGLLFTAVFGNNLEHLAGSLVVAFRKRRMENPQQLITIITCENLTGAAEILERNISRKLLPEERVWLSGVAGFSESIIFCTCLEASAAQPALSIRAQNFFELPCNGEAVRQKLKVYGLKPLKNFNNQLRRKIYTYNCINAIITYMGAEKGYTALALAARDAAILSAARKAADESSHALIAEFGFDAKEQEEWVNAAFVKFADQNIPDPIERNAADPIRKLGRDDRLTGPALLACRHNIYPVGLLEGIMACFKYIDPVTHHSVSDLITEKGPDYVLTQICGLSASEALFTLIKNRIIKSHA